MAVMAVTLLATACSGERPTLLAVQPTTTVAPAPTISSPDVAALEISDCLAVTGTGPWRSLIEASPAPPVPCGLLASHQRVEYVNNTDEAVILDLSRGSVTIDPGMSFVTEPVGTILQPGVNEINAAPHPVSALWLVETSQNPLLGEQVGLSSLGDIAIGGTVTDIAAAAGGAAVPSSEEACFVTSIAQDPYSPLFTVRNGALAVMQVFTPGQLTRSEIGVGASSGDVLAAYGDRVVPQPDPGGDPGRELLVFTPVDEADQQYRLVFVLDGGFVTSMRNGLSELAVANPDCAEG